MGAALVVPAATASATETEDRASHRAPSLDIVGLVSGAELVDFTSDSSRTDNRRPVTGLDGDQRLVGIDYRVQDGKLYGVGDTGGIYTVDADGSATKVRQLSVPLDGVAFGVDFNPAADALRVVSDTGQNLRQPFAMPEAATVADGKLTNPAAPPATGTVPATGVTGVAYTNNDSDTDTATTLYALDTTGDQIAIQSPANAGSLAATGKLGVDAGIDAGFDIYSTLRGDTAVDQTAFAALQVDGTTTLYRANLFTGSVARVGDLDRDVTDLAIALGH
ncbi:DUF4394 domain-containing protein [Pseudonocardia sediminis]|nr:DUF4394 domain-containing protein [Pseudonocardia sediminis]